MSNFFAIPITDEWGTTYQLTTAGYTALVVLMLALLLLACFIGNSVKQPKFSARQLAFSAMAIAAAFVTSEIKLFHLPFGGSITLFSMLFLVLIGYWYGLRAGLMTAIAYGFLQLVTIPVLSAAAVIGITTISANSILFSSKNQIKGLTTSVGLWCCGIVGLALGAGLYTLALVLFLALLCSMSGLPALETHLKDRSNHFEVHLELKNKLDLPGFVSTVRALGIRIDDIESNPAYLNSGLSVFTVSFTVSSAELKQYKKHGEIIEALRSLDYVYYIEEMN